MDKVVVITGASSGLGLSLSKRFVQDDCFVFGVSKTKKNWKALNKTFAYSSRLTMLQVDVTSEREVKQFVTNVYKKMGRIDILINSAGYSNHPIKIDKLSLKEFQKNLSANLISVFLMCKHSIPIFRKQNQGLIINISSMAGKRAVPRLAAYSASKFGVLALSQSIAKENESFHLKCVSVCPGGMNTVMRTKLFGLEDAQKQQSSEFVADVIMKVVKNEIAVDSGGDIVVRHGKITAINPVPPP